MNLIIKINLITFTSDEDYVITTVGLIVCVCCV